MLSCNISCYFTSWLKFPVSGFEMGMNLRHTALVVHGLRWLLILLSSSVGYGTQNDVKCLTMIKASLQDPYHYLNATWDFTNKTEGSICRFTGIECWHPDESRVLNIKLTEMSLKGQFPVGLEYCKSLTGLDLSGNSLSGPLPMNISEVIGYVTNLDLSNNDFSGAIPENLSNCTFLNDINLGNNQFSGQIPLALGALGRVKNFNVANNILSGQIPHFNSSSISKDNYANNLGLCGPPLDPCKAPTSKNHLAYMVGGIAGGLTFVIVLTGVAFIYISRMKVIRKKREDPEGNRWAKSMKKNQSC